MLAHPLVLIGLGSLGHRVARDLVDTARALDAEAPVARLPWTGGERGRPRLRQAAEAALADLLEAGRTARATLDVWIVGDLDEVPPGEAATVVEVLADLIADRYPVLFPADAPAHQRTAWATVTLATPPVRGPSAAPTLEALSDLEVQRASSPHPLLARTLLLPRQTTAGRLSDDAVERSLRTLGLGLFLTGVREADPVRDLLAHRDDDRFVVGVSVAAAELPLARLRRYARWRVAWDALSHLVEQAEEPTADPSRAEALIARLAVDALLDPFREGEAAQRVRRHAATLSGAVDRLPEALDVRLLERDRDLRSRFRVLLGPAVKPPPDRATDHPEHGEILRLLDREEAFAVADLDRRLERLLATELQPSTALDLLPHVEAALDRAMHTLDDTVHGPAPDLPERDPPPPPQDPGRDAVRAAVEGRPRWAGVLPLALGLGLALGTAAGWGTAALLAPEAAPPQALLSTATAPSVQPVWEPMAAGVLVGLGTATTWMLGVLHAGRVALQDALLARRTELEALWRRGGGGQPGAQGAALLAVRERRTARALRERLGQGRARLAEARAALRAARDHARRELERLRVRMAGRASADDLGDLLGGDTPLHRPLLPPRVVAAQLAGARTLHEPARLAQALLEATWPADGLVHDLPAADAGAVAQACDALVPELGTRALLRGDGARPQIDARLQAFLGDLDAGLAPGVDPRDVHGDPLPTGRPWMLLGPARLRETLGPSLQDHPSEPVTAWGRPDVPWVVAVATWPGLSVEHVRRGAG